jgi:CHAT domain-containing protein/tetratricopeptide (TPR) repeat protein
MEHEHGNAEDMGLLVNGPEAFQRQFDDPAAPINPLEEIARRFLNTIAWEDAYLVVREHPELLKLAGEEGETLRAAFSQKARLSMPHAFVKGLDEELALLRRCQELGIEDAFAEKLGCTTEELREIVAGSPPHVSNVMEEYERAEQLNFQTLDVGALDSVLARWEHALFPTEPEVGSDAHHRKHIKAHSRAIAWARAAALYSDRHSALGTMADLDRAITLWMRAVDELPAGSSERPYYLDNMSRAYRTRYDHTAQMEDLERAIALSRQVLDSASPDSPHRAGFLGKLGDYVRKRYEDTGLVEGLDDAISIFRQALDAAQPSSPDEVPRCCVGLGNALMVRYSRTIRMEDLEETIALHRRAMDVLSLDSPNWPNLLRNLGSALSTRHQRLGRMEDLEEAISVFRRAFDATPPDRHDRADALTNLATCLDIRCGKTGRIEDREEAIALFRQARAAAPSDSSRWMILNNLGTAVHKRYESTGQMDDLQEAIALFRYNVDATPPGSHGLPMLLANLGKSLGARYKRAGRMQDLEEAIAMCRRALDLVPAGSPERPKYLMFLGMWLGEKYESTERIEDLTEANAVHREAARLQHEMDSAAGMDRAYSRSMEVVCPQCGPVTVRIRLIVDLAAIQQRPELAAAIRDGTIHQAACSTCGSVIGVFNAPLLIHCPGPEPTFVFAHWRWATAEENQSVADALVERWLALADMSAASANRRVISMPRELLPVVVDEGVDAAQARLAEALAQPVDPVEAAVLQLVCASTWNEWYRLVRDLPDLADERAETLLIAERDRALKARDERGARVFEDRAGFLRRCREIGAQAAFTEIPDCTLDVLQVLDARAQAPRSIQDNIREAEQHETRYAQSKDMRALDAAAACWERVLSDPGLDLIPLLAKAELLSHAGALFGHMHENRGELPDLDRSIAVCRQALETLPPDYELRPIFLTNLGNSLNVRHTVTARLSDLEEAIGLCRHAVDTSSPGSPNWGIFPTNLGDCLRKRYGCTGQIEDLDEAIAFLRRAVDVSSTDPDVIYRLAAALRTRYARTGTLEDNEELIAISRQARDPTAPDRPACLGVLGAGLLTRYRRTGMVKDLEESITASQQGLNATPADSPDWLLILTTLGSALQYRYIRTGRMEDLQEAVALSRRAVESSPLDTIALGTLSNVLQMRYKRAGGMEDLQESIALLRRGVNVSAPGSLEHPRGLSDLSDALHQRYRHTYQTEDLEESIALGLQAVEAMFPDSRDRTIARCRVGSVLNDRYRLTGSMADLLEATAASRHAANSMSPGDANRLEALGSLADSLGHQHRHTGRIEDLEEAISIHRQVLNAMSSDSTNLPSACHNLSTSLYERYERTGRSEDLEEAMTLSRQASELGRALDPGAALYSTATRARWSLKRSAWKEAAGAYGEALTLVDMLCEAQVLRSDKHSVLRMTQLLHVEAAYSMARLGDLQGAVLAIETGRARVLTEMLDRSRADLEEIEKQAPELVHRYRQMLAQLRQLEGMAASGVTASTSEQSEDGRRLPDQIREAHAELHAAVAALRATPGGEAFLARPSVDTLVASIAKGVPVIYLAATSVGGIALVVSTVAGGLDVTPLWLDSLTLEAVDQIVGWSGKNRTPESWFGAYSQWRERPEDREARARWHEGITQTTRALWDVAMGPVVTLLRERFAGSEQAVLIPNGFLALLPLHAAWTDEDGGGPRWTLDQAAFCYAPSMRALAHARDTADRCGQTKLLVVNEPKPTSASPLQNSQHEVNSAAAQFAPDDVTLLAGEQCRRDNVLAAIEAATICHFSCHGANDWHNPLRSGLLMANDEMLTVEDLFALPGRQARMAVLSACETGIVGTAAPNEVVALPAAFLQAGFAGVVASLWPVYDISASLLMARFYELWRKEGLAPAVALRRAQVWLRDLTNRDLVSHLEKLVPELSTRMSLETAEALHFRAFVRDPEARSFSGPVHWAAFYLTGV